ncbi:MAG: hypothetical protein AB1768_06645 [Pseudomonadota bacterium]|jgi:NAD-dependent deacetylase
MAQEEFPAAEPPLTALRAGAKLVEVNAQETPLTPQAHFALRSAAGVLLPALLAAVG